MCIAKPKNFPGLLTLQILICWSVVLSGRSVECNQNILISMSVHCKVNNHIYFLQFPPRKSRSHLSQFLVWYNLKFAVVNNEDNIWFVVIFGNLSNFCLQLMIMSTSQYSDWSQSTDSEWALGFIQRFSGRRKFLSWNYNCMRCLNNPSVYWWNFSRW